eukprot:IDg23150t1
MFYLAAFLKRKIPKDDFELIALFPSSPLATCGILAERDCHRGEASPGKCPWGFGAALNAGYVGPKGI